MMFPSLHKLLVISPVLVAVGIAGTDDRNIGKLGIAQQYIGAGEQRDDHLEIGE